MYKGLIIPTNYQSVLDVKQTEKAIKLIKDNFQHNLASELKLRRITAPLFVLKGTGINDDLNGTERAVTFPIKHINDSKAEIVHSLAKWKRMMLGDLEIPLSYGLYTDMNAIRSDEDLDNTHSLYVDQWDWEQHISNSDRNLSYLKKTVEKIYEALKRTEYLVHESYPELTPVLPEKITFIQAEDLMREHPNISSGEREDIAAKKYGAIFIIGIGGNLSNGNKHDGRAPDYDDWNTPTEQGYKGLNGDLIVWNEVLNCSLELSSMGIRVNKESLINQLTLENCLERQNLLWHKRLLNDEMPLSIGGGIGQSRLCMFYLKKAHIGEVQSSIWDNDMIAQCKKGNIFLL